MNTARACPACRRRQPRVFCTHQEVQYARCGYCATLYQAAEPDRERIAGIYQQDYHAVRGHSSDPVVEATKQATMLAYLRMLEGLHPPGRRLVEVGCSAGAGLAAAARAGWRAEGVELATPAAQIARQRPGVQAVHTGRLQDAPLNNEQAHVFVLVDVIEHVDPPEDLLNTIYRLLCPGGLLLMVTPDGASLTTRLMKGRWPHLLVEHLVLFSRRGMRIALQETGFRVERIGFAWKRMNLEVMVRHATIHRHVALGRLLRLLGRVLPMFILRRTVPFNIGEFYVVARRPADSPGRPPRSPATANQSTRK